MTVELSVRCEQFGYDLVAFQDHPYQPRFLDTWTLLTWVAARTRQIRIASDVVNLPLRPPAVLARASISLDLLSGGRFTLGLGAGHFWDDIAAMGGRRLEPHQAVDALDEAIDVVRGIWASDDPTPLQVSGQYYHVDGAKRGPAAAHPISLWLGARRRRMLSLVGAKADGWWPSLWGMKPGELSAGNATIDAAADRARRRPADIRRLLNIGGTFAARNGGLLNGPSRQWVEQLLPLALEEGIGTFVFASDNPVDLQRFAEEVALPLRAAVRAERKTPAATIDVPVMHVVPYE